MAPLILAPVGSADVTIGADVTQMPSTQGTCAFGVAGNRPCVIVTNFLPGRELTSPCDGTVVRFRLNGFIRPNNHYGLRVVRKNGDGTFTGTASSGQVAIEKEGVNEYTTSLPIRTGEYIGIDFKDSTEEFGLRWVSTFPTFSELYFYAFPSDGGSASPTGPDPAYYLFNADIVCNGQNPPPAPTQPSNAFKVLGLKGKTLRLDLASAGAVRVTDATLVRKTVARAAKKGKGLLPTRPKLLKPASTSGGPGEVNLNLKLTGAAKKELRNKRKLYV